MVGEALLKHLTCIGDVSPADAEAVRGLRGDVQTVRKHRDVLKVGDKPNFVIVVLRGLLCRHSSRKDGRRQIHSFYLTADAPCLETLHLDYMDHDLGAVVDSTIAKIPHEEMCRVLDEHPQVRHLAWRETLIQSAIFREWLARNSGLPAHAAMAHLFCEMFVRARAVGLVRGNAFDMPTTQETLAAALGLTSVHVNRTLQMLRQSGLLEFKNGTVTLHDFDALAGLADFDPQYLHLRGPAAA